MAELFEITLNDKSLFDRYFCAQNPQISELTFTNLFMWRNCYKFRYVEIAGLLCIISLSEGSKPFVYMPVGKITVYSFREAVALLKSIFQKNGWDLIFGRVPESALQHFKELNDFTTDFTLDRSNSDYIYLTENLIRLSGKKYDGKRNHINRFKRDCEYEYVTLDSDLVSECNRIMSEWCAEKSCTEQKDLHCEKLANIELLDNFDALGCKGALVKVNGRFEGFTIGEMLNADTAVIHIEKANGKINGLYTFINQQFCENIWKDAMYINREQDLGIEGLRKAKLSYNPCRILDKYKVKMHTL